MLRGVKRKLMLLVAFYFAESGMNTIWTLFQEKFICAVQSAGYRIVCTVCDIVSTNVAAINALMHETFQYYLNKGVLVKFVIVILK